ncbi:MMPL family transporter [Nocardia cyriacigeorgica]|uniref:MMPL family transporter n=1 Tax=Nocardia cyriacigeorgica TaxID=135487 RepID=UPI001893D781|nr:MMPL family transporter [Nocardia cyriacigeorgica]MBF6102049.1 MMPL family transporter [Nocardia cyriacigeorgica]
MLIRIARLTTRFPRIVLAVAFALAVLFGIVGATASAHMKSGGFTTDDAESTRAAELLSENFPGASPNFVLLVSSEAGLRDPATSARATELVDTLRARDDISGIQSFWTSPPAMAAALGSTDGNSGLIIAEIEGDENRIQQVAGELTEQLTGTSDGVTVRQGGIAAVYHDVTEQITHDLAVAEAVAVPLSLIVLILVFGSLIAASLPVMVGLFAIAATLAILRVVTLFADVSIYALNMTTAMGLALAIDYSLFIVSRYREELAAGLDPVAATTRAVQTAGRTVLYSAVTVALSLAVLSVFDLYFLKSFAYAGVAVVLAAAAAALFVLPAALVLIGHRVNALDLRAPLRRMFGRDPHPSGPMIPEHTLWYRTTKQVMRFAVPVAVVIIALLLALGSPFLGVKFGYPDDRVMPDSANSRQVGDALREEFPRADAGASGTIVLDDFHDQIAVADYAARLSRVDDVPAVLSSAGVYVSGRRMAPGQPEMANDTGTYLTVATDLDPFSPEGSEQLEQLRAVPAPAPTLFTGAAAVNADSLDALGSKLLLAGLLIALATFVVLFLFTGSVVLPLKAIVLNTLSLTAAFGAMVWIFQEGHFSDLIGFTPVGYLVPTMPILMFCVAFGLSMDYEVFLLSRIREEWVARRAERKGNELAAEDNTEAVAIGVARTGRIFTAAAVLMAIVIGAMVTSKVSFIQLMGLGLTLTVLADATIIRALLAPALMRLLGPANWWAPKPLARLHAKFGLSEEPEPVARVPEPAGHR